jgi:hypothetical protein
MTVINGELRKEDIGSVIEIRVTEDGIPLNISTALAKQIILKKPSGSKLEKTAIFSTDGVDGKLQYVTIANDLSEAGMWQAQAKVVLASGTWKTEIINIKVHDNL